MSKRRGRMEAAADLLADEPGYEPEDITILAMTYRAVIDLVNRSVQFHLIADNVDCPDAEKYGTHPDGSPRYAPEWYMAQAIKTAIHEGLYGTLRRILSCEAEDDEGHVCIGSILHEPPHWDGNGANWIYLEEET